MSVIGDQVLTGLPGKETLEAVFEEELARKGHRLPQQAKRLGEASRHERRAARAACRGRGHLAEVDDWPAQVPPPQEG
jgi:hypothetical protein